MLDSPRHLTLDDLLALVSATPETKEKTVENFSILGRWIRYLGSSIYIYDITLAHDTWEEHISTLKVNIKKKVSLKLEKCVYLSNTRLLWIKDCILYT